MKSKDLIRKVDDLSFHVVDSEIRLRNTFNEFIMLADSQFMENRVYEDDDSEEVEEKEDGTARHEEDPLSLMKSAYTCGLQALKLFYSEEDDGNQDEKSEDIYNSRPLPFVIGTLSYQASHDVGVGGFDAEDDDEGDGVEQGVGGHAHGGGADDMRASNVSGDDYGDVPVYGKLEALTFPYA